MTIHDGDRSAKLWHLMVDHQAIREGHFVYGDRWHAQYLVDTLALFRHPRNVQVVGEELLRTDIGTTDVDTVLTADSRGGLLLAFDVAARLNAKVVLAKRGALASGVGVDGIGKRVLIVDDGINTGGSAIRLFDLAAIRGADVAGVLVFLDRFPGSLASICGGRVRALIHLPASYGLTDIERYPCDCCRQYVEVSTLLGDPARGDDAELLRLKTLLTARSGYSMEARA